MAGLTSGSDFEDVVNSIRLLVAEKAPAAAGSGGPASLGTARPAPTGRLAPLRLLPAFRVPPAVPAGTLTPMTLEQRMAALEARLSGLQNVESSAAAPAPSRPEVASPRIEEALIEEDSLREIVASLVRDELRGELGERITRNVRRMIRRELHQALALLDLEQGISRRPLPPTTDRDDA